jgi:hypothetical protein
LTQPAEFFTVVEKESSVLNLPSEVEAAIPVDGDHFTMIKFAYKGNTTYTSVLQKVKVVLMGIHSQKNPFLRNLDAKTAI